MLSYQKPLSRDEELELIATTLYEYQEFKIDLVINKVHSNLYSPNTLRAIFSSVRKFYNTGEYSNKKLPNIIYETISRLKREKHPLKVPKENERGCEFGSRGRVATNPISKEAFDSNLVEARMKDSAIKININPSTLSSMKHHTTPMALATPIKKQETLDESVGIRIGNTIKLFKNEDQLNGYLMACQEHSIEKEFKKVLIDIIPVED